MFEQHLRDTVLIFQSNPIYGWMVVGILAVLFYLRPKDMFKLVAFCIFLAALFYFMSYLLETVGSGGKQKDAMIYKTREAAGD